MTNLIPRALLQAGHFCPAFLFEWQNSGNKEGGLNILTYTARGHLSPQEVKTLIEQSLDADKGFDIVTIDLNETAIADYMIIASGTSSRHVSAMAEKLKARLEVRGLTGLRMEGMTQSDWVAIDAGDVIVHLFRPEVRAFYNIEKMWGAYQPFNVVSEQIQA